MMEGPCASVAKVSALMLPAIIHCFIRQQLRYTRLRSFIYYSITIDQEYLGDRSGARAVAEKGRGAWEGLIVLQQHAAPTNCLPRPSCLESFCEDNQPAAEGPVLIVFSPGFCEIDELH